MTETTNVKESSATDGREARQCQYPGCLTRLSVYNSDYLCWTHADVKTRARFDSLTRRAEPPRPIYRQTG